MRRRPDEKTTKQDDKTVRRQDERTARRRDENRRLDKTREKTRPDNRQEKIKGILSCSFLSYLCLVLLGSSWGSFGVIFACLLVVLGGPGIIFGRLGGRFGHLGAVLGGLGGVWGAVDGPNGPTEIWCVV